MENYRNHKTCQQCGNKMAEHATVCSVCGAGRVPSKNKWAQKLSGVKPVENKGKIRSRGIVIMLAFLGFGLGYFYLGYQDKFIHRASLLIRSFVYFITIVAAPIGACLLLYFVALMLWDMIYLTFIVKYDAYGNPIKLFKRGKVEC